MNYKESALMLQSYLHLEYSIVGITLFRDQATFDALNIKLLKHKIYYCQMIKRAAHGKSRKAVLQNFACETSAKILGLEPFYETDEGIQGWYDSGLYADEALAKRQHEAVFPIEDKTVGVAVEPLKEIDNDPDIVIIVCKPSQAMRLLQGYTYHYGYKNDFQMSGMCGVCFESTSLPLTKGEFSVSLLCSGTRFVCKWPDEMMMVSFPYSMYDKILDGVMVTAQRCETNAHKEQIRHRLEHHKLPLIKPLTVNKAYFYRKK